MVRALRRELPAEALRMLDERSLRRAAMSVAMAATAGSRKVPARAMAHLEEIAGKHNINPSDILGPNRHRFIVAARRDLVAALRADGLGAPTIGQILGRDPSTITKAYPRRAA